jgi:hypothetical protein
VSKETITQASTTAENILTEHVKGQTTESFSTSAAHLNDLGDILRHSGFDIGRKGLPAFVVATLPMRPVRPAASKTVSTPPDPLSAKPKLYAYLQTQLEISALPDATQVYSEPQTYSSTACTSANKPPE